MRKIRDRHRIFAEWRVAGLSQAQAALKAGYSIAKARRKGSFIEGLESVQEYMEDLREGLLDEYLRTTEAGREILKRNKAQKDGETLRRTLLLRLLRDDVHVTWGDRDKIQQWDADGNCTLTPSKDLSRRDRRLIQEVTQETTFHKDGSTTTSVKVKLEDRNAAKNRLMKWAGVRDEHDLLNKLKKQPDGSQGPDDSSAAPRVVLEIPDNARTYDQKE